MDSFYSEIHKFLILFSGLRIPRIQDSIKKEYVAVYKIYVFITDAFVVLSMFSIAFGVVKPNLKMTERSMSGFATIVCFQSFAKFAYCGLFSDKFHNLFTSYDGHFDNDPYLEDLKDVVLHHKRFMTNLSTFVFVFLTPPAFIWGMLPLLPIMQQLIGGKFTVVPAVFPFDSTKSPYFEMAVLFQSLGAVFVTSKNIAFDSLFYTLISRQTVQIKHLSTFFRKIFKVVVISDSGELTLQKYKKYSTLELESKALTPFQNEDFLELENRLRIWVEHHQHTIKIRKCLNRLYSPAFVLLLLFELLGLALNGFVCIGSDIDNIQFFILIVYIFGSLLQLFIICILGDLLTYQWRILLEEGFGTSWFVCPKPIKRSLEIIFQRCYSPFKLFGLGVFPVSAETFLSVVMSAYSYIMVLMQLKKQGRMGF